MNEKCINCLSNIKYDTDFMTMLQMLICDYRAYDQDQLSICQSCIDLINRSRVRKNENSRYVITDGNDFNENATFKKTTIEPELSYYKSVAHYSFHYTPFIQEYFYQLKANGDIARASVLSDIIQKDLVYYELQAKQCVIVPIPISEERLKVRGFNQVEVMLDASSIRYERILRTNKKYTQSQLTLEQRLALNNPFYIDEDEIKKVSIDFKDKTIIIVDDIITTGVTIHHAAQMLNHLNPYDIKVYAFANAGEKGYNKSRK